MIIDFSKITGKFASKPKNPYEQGSEAREQGKGWFSCPYSDPIRATQWFKGYDSVVKKDDQ